MERVEIPGRLAEDLVLLIRQNDGNVAQRRRTKEFPALTDAEVGWLSRRLFRRLLKGLRRMGRWRDLKVRFQFSNNPPIYADLLWQFQTEGI